MQMIGILFQLIFLVAGTRRELRANAVWKSFEQDFTKRQRNQPVMALPPQRRLRIILLKIRVILSTVNTILLSLRTVLRKQGLAALTLRMIPRYWTIVVGIASAQLLVNKELFHQSCFYLIKIPSRRRTNHTDSFYLNYTVQLHNGCSSFGVRRSRVVTFTAIFENENFCFNRTQAVVKACHPCRVRP